MVHLTRDEITTLCARGVDEVGGWTHDMESVECIDCLRAEILRQMAKNSKCHALLTTAARNKLAKGRE